MTIRRVIGGLLVVGIVVGAVWAWRLGAERSQLQATYTRLTTRVGDFAGGDPSKILIQALPTGQPMQFAWRVHLPPGPFSLRMESGFVNNSLMSKTGEEAIIRAAFREDQGYLFSYVTALGVSTTRPLGGSSSAGLLRDRWDEIIVEQAGQGETLVADPAKPVVFLRLTLPPALAEEAKTKLPKSQQGTLPILFEMRKP